MKIFYESSSKVAQKKGGVPLSTSLFLLSGMRAEPPAAILDHEVSLGTEGIHSRAKDGKSLGPSQVHIVSPGSS